MARALRAEGYDEVIPFNWVSRSNTPGSAVAEGRRLARVILDAAGRFPPEAPVDLHLIGHSEGAVIISQALRRLGPAPTLGAGLGFVKLTLLDPHPASNAGPGQQYSTSPGLLGLLAKAVIDDYQSRSHDPPVVVPPWVGDAEVFYQHTPASHDHGVNGHVYNLWGVVPVRGPAHYFDLTADSVTHSGKTGIVAWYQRNVVPTLGDGEPGVASTVLTGSVAGSVPAGPGSAVATHTPRLYGRAGPGSEVRLYAAPATDPDRLAPVGRTTAGSGGTWSLTTRPLADGPYRLLARAIPPRATDRLAMIPTAPLGLLSVRAG
jgi:hypothetical protein